MPGVGSRSTDPLGVLSPLASAREGNTLERNDQPVGLSGTAGNFSSSKDPSF